ncbi:MAG: M90 family metallopeptidase [Pseudomonadota bacterium]
MLKLFKNRRRNRIKQTPWPAEWDEILARNNAYFPKLSSAEQDKLRAAAQIMIAEKNWEAHQGQVISDEVQVTIAGTAALLLLGVDDFYFDTVRTIIIFPRPMRRQSQDGMIVGREHHNSGEAWQSGQIVFSWRDVLRDARHHFSGYNVVIHEFAHSLDGLDGEMGGDLMFGDAQTTKQWDEVSLAEYESLRTSARHRQPTLLDHYGATNRAEFFAVSSETFFERPGMLQQRHPELFKLLKEYYQLDPLAWI